MKKFYDKTTQFAIPGLTITSMVVISLKLPEWGLLINLSAQPFWLYSSFKGYKEAGQIGMFITSVLMTITLTFGVINYWIF